MKKLKIFLGFFLAASTIWSTGCKPDKKNDPQPTLGKVMIDVSNVAGSENLVLDTKTYTNAVGEEFSISTYKYYLTNFVLVKEDGSTYTQPESYYLMDASKPSSLQFTISNVPAGKYKAIRFLIGVDEPRNTSGAQDGALSPTLGMIWTWQTGYIMAKMEGTFNTTQHPNTSFAYHAGGFTGEFASQRQVTLALPTIGEVSGTSYPLIKMKSDALEWFKTPTPLSLDSYPDITSPGKDASMLANNYADMMSISAVQQMGQ